MAETKRGRLGVAELAQATNTAVYEVADNMDALVNISIVNKGNDIANVNMAIVDGGASDIANEDYIRYREPIDQNETLKINNVHLSADEAVVAYSNVPGVVVRIDGEEETTAVSPLSIQKLSSQSLAFGDFTDNANTTGYIDFTTGALPIGAIVLGWKATITEGFTGDTTAVLQVGVSGDVDAFSADTVQSCLAAGVVGSGSLASASAKAIAAVQTPRVTVTGGAGFGSISAGVMTVDIYYLASTGSTASTTYDMQKLSSQNLTLANFTDNAGTATGFIDFTSGVLPAGAIVIGWKAVVSEAFIGDVSADLIVGISGDTDAFSADTAQSCFTTGTIGSGAIALEAATPIASMVTPRVTVTTDADFTSLTAGAATVDIYYILTD